MRVVEIFKSIDGEGIRAGYLTTFIRLAGCNLRCSYCDTKYSYVNPEYTEMTVDEIVEAVYRLACKRITITGGEPLIHTDISELVERLHDFEFEVNIETNGSQDIRLYRFGNVIITLDYKCPSSGMEDKMFLRNIEYLREEDVLKFVVGTKEDLDVCLAMSHYTKANVFISPVFGKIEPKEIVEYMLEHNMQDCRIQLQLHKHIWEPDRRGV